MKTFEHFPKENICPICNTNEDEECTLIPVDGTESEKLEQATPVHTSCIYDIIENNQMRFQSEVGIMYFRIGEK